MKSLKQMFAVLALSSLLATGALAGDSPCGVQGSVNTKSAQRSSAETSFFATYVDPVLSYAAYLFSF